MRLAVNCVISFRRAIFSTAGLPSNLISTRTSGRRRGALVPRRHLIEPCIYTHVHMYACVCICVTFDSSNFPAASLPCKIVFELRFFPVTFLLLFPLLFHSSFPKAAFPLTPPLRVPSVDICERLGHGSPRWRRTEWNLETERQL